MVDDLYALEGGKDARRRRRATASPKRAQILAVYNMRRALSDKKLRLAVAQKDVQSLPAEIEDLERRLEPLHHIKTSGAAWSPWTLEMVERLAALADRRCSSSMIMETLNAEFGVSLNIPTVKSKAWREGIKLHGVGGQYDRRPQSIAAE